LPLRRNDIEEGVEGLIRSNHDAIVKIVTDIEWIKKSIEELKKTIDDDIMPKIDELEKFKSKFVGVAVGVSATVSVVVTVIGAIISYFLR